MLMDGYVYAIPVGLVLLSFTKNRVEQQKSLIALRVYIHVWPRLINIDVLSISRRDKFGKKTTKLNQLLSRKWFINFAHKC